MVCCSIHTICKSDCGTLGEYEPLPLNIPEQQSRYLAAGSFLGRNPSKVEQAKYAAQAERAKEILGQRTKAKSVRDTTSAPGGDSKRKQIQMPVSTQGGGIKFINNLYMEEPPHQSCNWKTMFRSGNVTFLNHDEAKRER